MDGVRFSISSLRLETVMPVGKVPNIDKPRTNSPSTNTNWAAAPSTRHALKSESERCVRGCPKENAVRAIAETLVNRQSSSCVVGKPVSQKRANASSRSFRSHGCPCPEDRLANAVKLSRYFSRYSVAVITLAPLRDCPLDLRDVYTEAGAVWR